MEIKKIYIFFVFCQIGNFCLELGKNILFGIGNGAEFWPQNRVIKSPDYPWHTFQTLLCLIDIDYCSRFGDLGLNLHGKVPFSTSVIAESQILHCNCLWHTL